MSFVDLSAIEYVRLKRDQIACIKIEAFLGQNQIKEAVKFFWNNANITFSGHDVMENLKDHPKFKEFEDAYYADERLGEYTDQP